MSAISYVKKIYYRYCVMTGIGMLYRYELAAYHLFLLVVFYFFAGYMASFFLLMKDYLLATNA
jgi:hypothetical protein